jgi:hypothetical protein
MCADGTAQTGKLQNDMQTNCPTVAPCPSTGCECPIDNNADTGVLINQFKVRSPVTCVGFAEANAARRATSAHTRVALASGTT